MEQGVRNILLNLSNGLLPKDLSKKDVSILIKEFGKEWFFAIGYSEKKFEKPKFR